MQGNGMILCFRLNVGTLQKKLHGSQSYHLIRYIIECRVYVPPQNHDHVSDLPPFPGHLQVHRDHLSETTREDIHRHGMTGKLGKKLAPNLLPKVTTWQLNIFFSLRCFTNIFFSQKNTVQINIFLIPLPTFAGPIHRAHRSVPR